MIIIEIIINPEIIVIILEVIIFIIKAQSMLKKSIQKTR